MGKMPVRPQLKMLVDELYKKDNFSQQKEIVEAVSKRVYTPMFTENFIKLVKENTDQYQKIDDNRMGRDFHIIQHNLNSERDEIAKDLLNFYKEKQQEIIKEMNNYEFVKQDTIKEMKAEEQKQYVDNKNKEANLLETKRSFVNKAIEDLTK